MDIFQDLLGCLSIHYGHFTLHVHFLERSSPFWLQSAARFRTYQIDLLLPICLELFRAILCLSPDCCRWCHFRMMIFNTQSSWLQWWPHVSLSTMSFWKMRSGRVGNACFGNDVLMFDFLVVLDFALISAVVCMFRIFTSFCKDQHFRFDSSLLFRDENRWRRCNKMQHVQRCERSIMLRIAFLILFQQALWHREQRLHPKGGLVQGLGKRKRSSTGHERVGCEQWWQDLIRGVYRYLGKQWKTTVRL